MREKLCEVCKHEDCEDATCKIGYQDHRPVVEELEDSHSLGKEADQKTHCISCEKLASKYDDQKDSNRKEQPSHNFW
jgi:hypothetical protein